jgi:protein-glucosylgalactosylhydroxylysine glucosidase
MAAARMGKPQLAVEILLKDIKKNSYTVNGINDCWYFPGNGGLLYAVAMMAAGWNGAPDKNAPGFPDDGTWVVKWEALKKAL